MIEGITCLHCGTTLPMDTAVSFTTIQKKVSSRRQLERNVSVCVIADVHGSFRSDHASQECSKSVRKVANGHGDFVQEAIFRVT